MKRIFEITIFALLVATLAACGNDADSKAIEKIQTFYSRHIFGNEFANDSVMAKYCTKELAQKLRDDYDNEYSDVSGYAVWKFRSGAQDGKDIHEIEGKTASQIQALYPNFKMKDTAELAKNGKLAEWVEKAFK